MPSGERPVRLAPLLALTVALTTYAVAEGEHHGLELRVHHQVAVEGAESVGVGVLPVLVGRGDLPAPEQVVADDDAAHPQLGQDEVQVLPVLGLHRVHVDEIERAITNELVRDADAAASRIARLRLHAHSFTRH